MRSAIWILVCLAALIIWPAAIFASKSESHQESERSGRCKLIICKNRTQGTRQIINPTTTSAGVNSQNYAAVT
jgi:hypothetical protein